MIRLPFYGTSERAALPFRLSVVLFSIVSLFLFFTLTPSALAAPTASDTAEWVNLTTIKVGDTDFKRTQSGPTEWIFTYTETYEAAGGYPTYGTVTKNCDSTLTFTVNPYQLGGGQLAIRDFNLVYTTPTTRITSCERVPGGDGYLAVSGSLFTASTPGDCAVAGGTWEGVCVQPASDSPANSQVLCEETGGSWQDDQCVPLRCDDVAEPSSLRWIGCPLVDGMTSFFLAIDGFIADLLNFDVKQFEESQAKTAWNNFRVLAYALVLIAGLIIVISHALGTQLLDAYTIKKAVPRLLVAVILIAISWDLLLFLVRFANEIGHVTENLLLEPFKEAQEINLGKVVEIVILALLGAPLGAAAAAFGVLYIYTIGLMGTITLILTALFAILIGFVVLGFRDIVITIALIVAPLAIASFILPGTQKLWDLWRKALTTALMVFPIIMAMLASGKIAASLTQNGLFMIIFLIAPYFLIPFTFKFAGGLIGRIAGMADDKSRGVFDRARNFRKDQYAKGKEEYAKGERKGTSGRVIGDFHRRTMMARQGGFSMTTAGRKKYAGAVEAFNNTNALEALKNDRSQSTGDDDATLAAKGATSRRMVVNRLMALRDDENNQRYTQDQAEAAVGRLENAFGDVTGVQAQRAIRLARLTSPTAYTPKTYDEEGRRAMYDEIVGDMKDLESMGMARDSVIATLRSNQARVELSGIGHGDWLKIMGTTDRGRSAGQPIVDAALSKQIEDFSSEQVDPYSLAKANDRSIKILANKKAEKIRSMGQTVTLSNGEQVTSIDLDSRAVQQEYASLMGTLDQLNHSSPQKAKIMADVFMASGGMFTNQETLTRVETLDRQRTELEAQSTRIPQGTVQRVVLEENKKALDSQIEQLVKSTTNREIARIIFDNSSQYTAAQEMRREIASSRAAEYQNAENQFIAQQRQAEDEARANQGN